MRRKDIKSIIVEQILEIAPDIAEDEIMPDENLQRSLELDSFDFLKILTAINEEVGVEVPESDYSKVDTLNHMTDYFAERL